MFLNKHVQLIWREPKCPDCGKRTHLRIDVDCQGYTCESCNRDYVITNYKSEDVPFKLRRSEDHVNLELTIDSFDYDQLSKLHVYIGHALRAKKYTDDRKNMLRTWRIEGGQAVFRGIGGDDTHCKLVETTAKKHRQECHKCRVIIPPGTKHLRVDTDDFKKGRTNDPLRYCARWHLACAKLEHEQPPGLRLIK